MFMSQSKQFSLEIRINLQTLGLIQWDYIVKMETKLTQAEWCWRNIHYHFRNWSGNMYIYPNAKNPQ